MDASIERHPDFKFLKEEKKGDEVYFYPANVKGKVLLENFLSYDADKKMVVMQNDMSFPVKSLLMGCTSKEDNTEALGQFGEGKKLAMIVLLKAGYHVTF